MKSPQISKSLLWYSSGIFAVVFLVLVSGCTAPSSHFSLPGISSSQPIGTVVNIDGLDVTVTSAKIVNVSPFAATYKKNTGKDLPPSKNLVASIGISNPGSTTIDIGQTEFYPFVELRAGDGTKYDLSPQGGLATYVLKSGEKTTFIVYGDVGNNGTDTALTKLKQHAELVLLKVEGDKVVGDIAKWDVTPVFNG